MIKILYITSTLEKCGPNNQLYGLIKGLDKERFKAEVLTLSEEKENSMMQKFLDDGINVECLKLSRWKFQLLGKYFLRSYLGKVSPDIIHTQGVRADDKVSKLKEYRKIHCMTLRNYIYDDYEDKYGVYKGKIYSYLHYQAIKRSKYTICCSKSIAKKYEELFHRKFLYVQNGVDTDTYCVKDSQEKNDKKMYITIGSLIPRKDPLTVIRAFNAANIANYADLLVLGDGALKTECEREAKEGIKICGEVKNVVPYLQKADCFISASRSEGLPNAVLEAGLCGCKLILSDIPQHIEIASVVEAGRIDIFSTGNVEELTHMLKQQTDCSENVLKETISMEFKKGFSSTKMSKQYQDIYLKMAGNCR